MLSQRADRVDRRLRKLPTGARVRVAREQIARLRVLGRQIDALARELLELIKAHRAQLFNEAGCGALTAYLARKRAEGKTAKGAIRGLKRHLARRVHHVLSRPPITENPGV